jgi:LacI family transcriptional regulator
VLFGRSELNVPWVDIDNRVGGELAARHLLELGHRRLAHIAAPTRFTYASERCEGFVETVVAELGASARPRVADADLTAESAYRAAEALLDATVPPTAIFAASDLMASGVLACAQRRGLAVPEQLSIVGYDDTHLARSGFPTLTTVSQEPRRIGRRVGELLLQHLSDGSVQTELVVPTLRTGESTAAPPPHDR